jgi:hypothetical protein
VSKELGGLGVAGVGVGEESDCGEEDDEEMRGEEVRHIDRGVNGALLGAVPAGADDEMAEFSVFPVDEGIEGGRVLRDEVVGTLDEISENRVLPVDGAGNGEGMPWDETVGARDEMRESRVFPVDGS